MIGNQSNRLDGLIRDHFTYFGRWKGITGSLYGLVFSRWFFRIPVRMKSNLHSGQEYDIIDIVFNSNISKGLSIMDTRLLVIALPLLVAASWALFNIGRLAIQQIQRLSRG